MSKEVVQKEPEIPTSPNEDDPIKLATSPDSSHLMIKTGFPDSPDVNVSEVSTVAECNEFWMPVPLAISSHAINEIFGKVAEYNGFDVIEDDIAQATAVRDGKLGWKAMFARCFQWGKVNQPNTNEPALAAGMIAIRLYVVTNTTKCYKTIILKSLCGDKGIYNSFVNQFKKLIEEHEKTAHLSPGPAEQHKSFFSDGPLAHETSPRMIVGTRPQPKNPSLAIKEEDEAGSQLKSNMESYSVYHFNKILASDSYSLGKRVTSFISDFLANNKKTEESAALLPEPLEGIMTVINETIGNFFAEFNYGKAETRKIMPYCRFAVEKYIFEKLYSPLFSMYLHRSRDLISAFEERRIALCNNTLEAVLVSLDIKRKYWLIEANNPEKAQDLVQSVLQRRVCELTEAELPYCNAINELDKLEKLWNPREKLNSLLMMQSLMRSCVVEHYHGREELASMDDELPILIFIVLKTRNINLPADIQFIEQYIGFHPEHDYEQRLLTNLKVSIQYICKEWTI